MEPAGYVVKLEAFEGPLDLLLYLIRRSEVEITDIPISTIADQYIAQLEGIVRIDIELAGEFLVMAATLMEIKSRMLTPAVAPSGDGDEGEGAEAASREPEDPRAELVAQLLAYKRYRDAADALERRREEWARRAPTRPAAVDEDALEASLPDLGDLELDDLELYDVVEAFARILATVDLDRATSGGHSVAYDDTPIELHATDLRDRLLREPSRSMTLRSTLSGKSRGEMIGMFLALLELVRRRSVRIRMHESGEDLVLTAADEESDVRQPSEGEPA